VFCDAIKILDVKTKLHLKNALQIQTHVGSTTYYNGQLFFLGRFEKPQQGKVIVARKNTVVGPSAKKLCLNGVVQQRTVPYR
jgi:hypothetical protein